MTTEQDVWLPKGHVERLVVGARVRIRFNNECDVQGSFWCSRCGVGYQPRPEPGHHRGVSGLTGVITQVDFEGMTVDHPFLVTLDTPIHDSSPCGHIGWLVEVGAAATELIPLDDADEVQS